MRGNPYSKKNRLLRIKDARNDSETVNIKLKIKK
jgi:hypothetical protein